MKRCIIIVVLVVIAILAIYLWPVPRADFAELAGKVAPEVRQSLLNFQADYPLNHVQVGHHTWEYVTFGDGEKSILFLHGMTGAYDIWWQQMLALSDQFTVISLTYPAVSTLEKMSQGVLAVLDTEGIQKTNLVGTSLGGYLAQYLMAQYPERIEAVVLGNTFPPNDLQREKNESLINLLPFLPNWLVMKVFRGSIEENVYPASGYSALVLAYMLEQVSGRMSKAQITARAKAVIDSFTAPDPELLKIPVMIIEADNDPLVERVLREQLKTTYPTARVKTLHSVGHFPYLNEAEVYTELLESYLMHGINE